MAKKSKTNESANGAGDGPTKGHNVKQINEAINGGFEEIYKLEGEIDAAIEKHVQKLKDARTAKWRTMKADTAVNRRVLNAHYRLFKMKKDAELDEEAGDETIDMMRIAYGALAESGQLDWVAVTEDYFPKGKAPSFTGGDEANP